MKVLLVTGSYPPMRCGVGDYTERLARALREQSEIELQVLTSQLGDAPRNDPPWLRRVLPSWRISALPRFLAVARAFAPDIVHLQYPTQGYRNKSGLALIPVLARSLLGSSVVETWHEYPPSFFTKGMLCMCALAFAAETVTVVRPEYLKHIRGLLAAVLGKTPIRFVPNASVIPAVELTPVERAELRSQLGCGERRLVSFFGFAYPHKGVDQLFEIADPQRHHLLVIGELSQSDAYHERLRALADSDRWRGKVTVAGFVNPERAARLLAASDAAVFPFSGGGGTWNSSVHAATSQGTFTIITSRAQQGYAADQNMYYAPPGAIDEMRAALDRHAGSRTPHGVSGAADPWPGIAQAHAELYRSLMRPRTAWKPRP